MPTVRKILHN